ncbi:MAG: hypothetical protein KAV87_36435 [Desulfobacteraceae bacterium]|nr:hypothetical protein [Desulfobacteraceae bacterium]
MKKFIILFILMALLCSPSIFAKEPFRTTLKQIAKDNPDLVILNKWQEKTQKKYDETGLINPQFSFWSEISTLALLKLFPAYRFYTISWNENATDTGKERHVSCAYGLYTMLSIHQETDEMKEYFGYGNYAPFGELLAMEKIQITSEEQAKLVWDAFRDLHQKHWKNQTIKQMNTKKWHLGVIAIDNFNYYYEVNLDDDGVVINGKLHADKIEN